MSRPPAATAAAANASTWAALLAVSAYQIDVQHIVWPFIGVIAVMLPLIHVAPRKFKIIEGAAALLALVQMLAPALRHGWRALT